jgi:hypothetical protein
MSAGSYLMELSVELDMDSLYQAETIRQFMTMFVLRYSGDRSI